MDQPSVLGIISYKVFPVQMGGQQCAVQFYKHLADHTRVILAVSKDNKEGDISMPGVHPFLYHHRIGLANLLRVFRLRKMIRQEKIDVISIEHSYLGWLGVILRWLTKKPFVIRSHNIEAHRFRDMNKALWPLYQVYEKWVHKKADHSFFICAEDREFAITQYKLDEARCSVATCGTEQTSLTTQNERVEYRRMLLQENNLRTDTRLFLFNGTLDYLPNSDALRIIITELLGLLRSMRFPFAIFVCGKRLSQQWQKVLAQHPSILYKGFVSDITAYYKGADCFINPVTLGGGIKTKLIGALACNQVCVSTESGARGIPEEARGDKLVVVPDYNWPAFANTMRTLSMANATDTPAAFYQIFAWDAIVQKALLSLRAL